MQRSKTMSWLEILIIDLALILAVGVMGVNRSANRNATRPTTDKGISTVVVLNR